MSASRFDKLETRTGESGRRLAKAEAAERLVRVAKLSCPEFGLVSFEVNYREALEALLLTLAPPACALPSGERLLKSRWRRLLKQGPEAEPAPSDSHASFNWW